MEGLELPDTRMMNPAHPVPKSLAGLRWTPLSLTRGREGRPGTTVAPAPIGTVMASSVTVSGASRDPPMVQ